MKLLLISNSRTEGLGYLEHALPEIRRFLGASVKKVLFLPFAGVTIEWDEYTRRVAEALELLGLECTGAHTEADAFAAIRAAQAIAVGGGNTWQLTREIHRRMLAGPIREAVRGGTPYFGWSAGANVACPTMQTTNDMPICDPLGFDALGLVPFQINPHYLHGNPPGFKGETREERIFEYGKLHPKVWVAGLREGSILRIEDAAIRLVGGAALRAFHHGEPPREVEPGADCSFLLS